MDLDPTRTILLYLITPVWIAAGLADYLCHRASDIEHTSGVKESLLHLLQFGQIGAGLLAALLLEINALAIGGMIAIFLLHEATALWDVRYAVTRRVVTPIEQHIHSFLEMLPLTALLMICALHWPQVLALFGLGDESARWTLRWKPEPLSPGYVLTVLAAAAIFGLVPYLEELYRGLRASRARAQPAAHSRIS